MVDDGPDAHIYRWWKNACLVLAAFSWIGLAVTALATALF